MKKTLFKTILIAVITLCYNVILTAQESPRSRELFNDNWKFVKYFNAYDESITADKEPAGLEMPGVADKAWRTVDLPHDWAIEGPFSDTLENFTALLPWKGIGWYRKHFTVNEADKDKRFYIDFDGAMAYSKVWLNGMFVGEWPYGYTS
ncbi:MAG: beta-galactosidase, partial [Bacteroidota bacterium]|nr:beta-galactosidase [Bacteroidota bacterium]